MTDEKRQSFLEKIASNIRAYGHHVYMITGGPLPTYAYTIGLNEKVGVELVFAGAAFFSNDEVLRITNAVARHISLERSSSSSSIDVGEFGHFLLQEVEESWGQRILLGALDYYRMKLVKSLQIVPDSEHWTIDTPDMRDPWSPARQPIWKWLGEKWEYPVSPKSVAVTNLDALRGQPVTELMRWEAAQWELFAGAGPDVEQGDIRTVPLGTMLGYDASLEPIVSLEIGFGLWREGKANLWHSWGKR